MSTSARCVSQAMLASTDLEARADTPFAGTAETRLPAKLADLMAVASRHNSQIPGASN